LTWVFLEILLALAIAVLIVWWTVPRKPRGGDDSGGGRVDYGKRHDEEPGSGNVVGICDRLLPVAEYDD